MHSCPSGTPHAWRLSHARSAHCDDHTWQQQGQHARAHTAGMRIAALESGQSQPQHINTHAPQHCCAPRRLITALPHKQTGSHSIRPTRPPTCVMASQTGTQEPLPGAQLSAPGSPAAPATRASSCGRQAGGSACGACTSGRALLVLLRRTSTRAPAEPCTAPAPALVAPAAASPPRAARPQAPAECRCQPGKQSAAQRMHQQAAHAWQRSLACTASAVAPCSSHSRQHCASAQRTCECPSSCCRRRSASAAPELAWCPSTASKVPKGSATDAGAAIQSGRPRRSLACAERTSRRLARCWQGCWGQRLCV